MYYMHQCTYCTKTFYVFSDSKMDAARKLYKGIKQHLMQYDEDRKEFLMDGSPDREANEMYYEMIELNEPPTGGYPL